MGPGPGPKLDTRAALPGATDDCCTDDHTLGNLGFACTMARTRQIDPLFRTRQATIIQGHQAFHPSASDDVSNFAAPRQWKNEFQ